MRPGFNSWACYAVPNKRKREKMDLKPTRAYDVVLDDGPVFIATEPWTRSPQVVTGITCPYGPPANRTIAFYNGDSMILSCSYNDEVYVA